MKRKEVKFRKHIREWFDEINSEYKDSDDAWDYIEDNKIIEEMLSFGYEKYLLRNKTEKIIDEELNN